MLMQLNHNYSDRIPLEERAQPPKVNMLQMTVQGKANVFGLSFQYWFSGGKFEIPPELKHHWDQTGIHAGGTSSCLEAMDRISFKQVEITGAKITAVFCDS